MIITLPVTSAKLHAHPSGSWWNKCKHVSSAKNLAFFVGCETRAGKTKRKSKCTIAYRFFVPDLRLRDEINLCQMCKPYIDGLVDAGVIYRDDWQWLHTVGICVEVDRDNPRVELTITEVISC